jgi:hypothetical protein
MARILMSHSDRPIGSGRGRNATRPLGETRTSTMEIRSAKGDWRVRWRCPLTKLGGSTARSRLDVTIFPGQGDLTVGSFNRRPPRSLGTHLDKARDLNIMMSIGHDSSTDRYLRHCARDTS